MLTRCTCLIFLLFGIGCDLYAMDPLQDSTSKEYLDALLTQQKYYELQQTLYNHCDTLHSPWIGLWLSEKIKGDNFGDIVLLYFDIRWYVGQAGLKSEDAKALFTDLMMFIFRFYQDTVVCVMRDRFESVANYDYLVKGKIGGWANKFFEDFGDLSGSSLNLNFEIIKSKLGVSTNIYTGELSYPTFKTIPQTPALACSLQRSFLNKVTDFKLLKMVGFYSEKFFFNDPDEGLKALIDDASESNNKAIHELRAAATVKFISFLNWIMFDQSNQQLKNGQKWAKLFSKSFKEINDTDWVVTR